MYRPLFIVFALLLATMPYPQAEVLDAEISPQFNGEGSEPLGWAVTVGGFGEDSINALAPLDNNSVLVGGSFTSSILIGDGDETIHIIKSKLIGIVSIIPNENG